MDSRSKDLVRQQYSRQAHLYPKSRPHALGDTLELLVRWAACQGIESVLDVACGCGGPSLSRWPFSWPITALKAIRP